MTTAHRELWKVGPSPRKDTVFPVRAIDVKKRERERYRENYKRTARYRNSQRTRVARWKKKLPEIEALLRERGEVGLVELAEVAGMKSTSFIGDLTDALPIYETDSGKIGLLED